MKIAANLQNLPEKQSNNEKDFKLMRIKNLTLGTGTAVNSSV